MTGLTGRGGLTDGREGVEEVKAVDLVEEGCVAGVPLELAVSCLDLGEEVSGGDVLAGLDDALDDVAQRVVVDARRCGLAGLLGLLREVVRADGEVELRLVGEDTQVVSADVTHGSDLADGGQREDVVGAGEQELSQFACGAGFFSCVVVADEQEGGVGVVDGVTDDTVELVGHPWPAVWHEVVDVVDDDELWLEALDELLDVACEAPVVVALSAEDVEAGVVERLAGLDMLREFAEDGSADVWAVECVYPQDAGAVGGWGGV